MSEIERLTEMLERSQGRFDLAIELANRKLAQKQAEIDGLRDTLLGLRAWLIRAADFELVARVVVNVQVSKIDNALGAKDGGQ